MLGQLALIRIKGLHGPNKETCRYSYMEPERTRDRIYLRQKCRNPDYNSSKNVHDNVTEDWGRDFCRFWAPKKERIGS